MVAMVASASGYGTLRRFLSAPDGQDVDNTGVVPSASVAVSKFSVVKKELERSNGRSVGVDDPTFLFNIHLCLISTLDSTSLASP
ncbi:unnamed protein product [Danaus chrysippus]|uniref:(African queen) hypothetical protein n=1 Tax=Danaus chrysippus TaxID=151541 RepID=A0A8J2W423_9NEOP|nr:unnamed protein product [Danaus chrysippus]